MNIEEIIIRCCLEGMTQIEISKYLKQQGISTNSLSFVEKQLKALRQKHNAKTMCHLGAILTIKRYLKPKS